MLAHPSEPSFPLIGAGVAVAQGEEAAPTLINRAMELAPGWASPHELAASWLLRRGRSDQALLEVREAAVRDHKAAGAILCRMLGGNAPATIAFRAAPDGREGIPLLENAAKCLAPDPARAEVVDAEILRRDPSALEPQLRRVRRLLVQTDARGAEREARALAARHPESDAVIAAWAETLLAIGQPAGALDTVRDAQERGGDMETLLRIEARAHAALDDADAMREAVERLRILAAGDARHLAEAMRLRATLEAELGNQAQALEVLENAQRLDPRRSTLVRIARLAETLGARERARRAYAELASEEPETAAYRDGLERTSVRARHTLDPPAPE
jgi:tetratricopeptide (TPR) repeat protein